MTTALPAPESIDLRLFCAFDLWSECTESTSQSGRLIMYMGIFDEFLNNNGVRYGIELTREDSSFTSEWKARELALFLCHAHSANPAGSTARPFTFDSLYHDSLMLVLSMKNTEHDELIEPGLLLRAKELIEYVFELCELDAYFLRRYHQQKMLGEISCPSQPTQVTE